MARITMKDIRWYIPDITHRIPQQTPLKDYVPSGSSTQLSYFEKFVGVKPVDTQFRWLFDLEV